MNRLFTAALLTLCTLAPPAWAEVKEAKLLARGLGAIRVHPVTTLEAIEVWTNFSGCRIEFKAGSYGRGYGLAYLTVAEHDWARLAEAMDKARSAPEPAKESHIRWSADPGYPAESTKWDPLDITVCHAPGGRIYRLVVHSDKKAHDTTEAIRVELTPREFDGVRGWIAEAVEQSKRWPKSDPNPWNEHD